MLVSKSITASFTVFDRRKSLETGVLQPTVVELWFDSVFSYENIKRAFDLIGATVLLVILSPVMLLVAMIVRCTSRGAVIYCQQRLTHGGKVFTMYKFRTMRTDAESRTGAVWAVSSDPRVTGFGRFLRVSRLDELPQLINVILGDMSLIGPRPERPELAARLEREIPLFSRRVEVKAGITGLAQIATGYAASVGTYKTKIAFDIEYVENRSLLLDATIAWKTVKVILTGAGAR